MTQSSEIIQLITEGAASPAERRDLEQVARALERLEGSVPYRPEFRAQLRARLKEEARRMRPWYRRPMLWTTGGAVAAAVAAFAVLSFWNGPAAPPHGTQMSPASAPPSGLQEEHTTEVVALPDPHMAQPINPSLARPQAQLVSHQTVPRISLPDEWLLSAPKAGVGTNAFTVLVDTKATVEEPVGQQRVYTIIHGAPLRNALADRARLMGFRSEVTGDDGGPVSVSDGGRSLVLHPDGRLVYEAPAEGLGLPAQDQERAERVAQRWLQEAGIHIPSGVRAVVQKDAVWEVTYTPVMPSQAEAATESVRVWVTASGHVIRAEAMTGVLEEGPEVRLITFSEAVEQMRSMRLVGVEGEPVLTVTDGALIYARATTGRPGSPVYLLPYWRLTVSVGDAVLYRYVPAIHPDHLE